MNSPSLLEPRVELSGPNPAAFDGAGRLPALVTQPDALTPILVADDDADDVYFIRRLIAKTGIKNPVKVFEDGTEVVNYLGARLAQGGGRHRPAQLLFLDLNMAGLGGFGFLEWARQQPGLTPLTIVVLSNSGEPADIARALELGAHRYLVKYPCVQTITTIVRSVHPFTLV
ncbi:MAG TPA: response regulator [Opitutaceae bacterium]|nr:response regulator [Opitutaceae bacterium]